MTGVLEIEKVAPAHLIEKWEVLKTNEETTKVCIYLNYILP